MGYPCEKEKYSGESAENILEAYPSLYQQLPIEISCICYK